MKITMENELNKMIEDKTMVFNLAIDDVLVSTINSDYHRTVKDVVESLQCMELRDDEWLEIWKADDKMFASTKISNNLLEEVTDFFKNKQEEL